MQPRAGGTCSLGLGRGRRPKGTGGLLAEGGGERSQGVAGTAAAEQPHTRSQASGVWSRYRWRRKSVRSPHLLLGDLTPQRLTMRNGALARSSHLLSTQHPHVQAGRFISTCRAFRPAHSRRLRTQVRTHLPPGLLSPVNTRF